MKIELKMNPREEILKKQGLGEGGAVQKFIDAECIRLMRPYTPKMNGILAKSATLGTVIGSGKIEYQSPYARYQYYGKLMVDPKTKKGAFYSDSYGFWSRPGVKKEITDIDLVYNTHKNQKAGKLWFERMKADHREEILKGAQTAANKHSQRGSK